MNLKRLWLLVFAFAVFAIPAFSAATPIPLGSYAYSLDGTHPPAPPIPL